MSKKSIQPEDILPDGVDKIEMNGRVVRKGTIAAFLANIEIFEDFKANEEQKQEAAVALKNLASAVVAIGLHKHVIFKNPKIEQILIDADNYDN